MREIVCVREREIVCVCVRVREREGERAKAGETKEFWLKGESKPSGLHSGRLKPCPQLLD
jgi:hypothetical protein